MPRFDRNMPHADDLAFVAVRAKARRIADARSRGDMSPVGRLPHQQRPDGDWMIWMVLGGRGSGKTWIGAREVIEHLRTHGANAWVTIVGPTKGMTRSVCLEGPSGLFTLYHREFPEIGTLRGYNRSEMLLRHINGGRVVCYGAEDPERLNGPEHSLLWCDEIGIWDDKDTLDQALFGLRHGADPRAIITTTAKSRAFLADLIRQPDVVVTKGKTSENPHLADKARARFYQRYANTRLERQELDGELIEDIEGAMWSREWIERSRIAASKMPSIIQSVLVVDPAATSMSTSDETAWAVVALGDDGDYYVKHSRGCRDTPAQWGDKIVRDCDLFEPARLIAEKNQGGEMVEHTLRTAAAQININLDRFGGVELFSTTRGKEERAAPVSALYEQGRVHHVGFFEELENQQCTFPVDNDHDDRLDTVMIGVRWLATWKEKRDKDAEKKVPTISASKLDGLLKSHRKARLAIA